MSQQQFDLSNDARFPAATLITMHSALVALSHHIGQGNGIHSRELARKLVGTDSGPAAERRLRAVITELRLEGHHVCGTPETGYYMAESPEELNRTCLFLHDRAMASLKQVARMKNIALPDLRGQLHLPT